MIREKFKYILNQVSIASKRHSLPRVMVNSIPKSGTNLLKNIVATVPNMSVCGDVSLAAQRYDSVERIAYIRSSIGKSKPGCIYTGHIPFSEEIHSWLSEQKLKHIFLYRDPRDVTVSIYHYIMKEKTPRHAYYDMFSKFGSDHVRLMKVISGFGGGEKEYRNSPEEIPSIKLAYESYESWMNRPDVLAVRYEDLIGPARIQTVESILKFIEVNYSIDLLSKINSEGYNPKKSHTFRDGVSGGWKNEYKLEHIDAFRRVFSDEQLALWGYTWED
ncbi:MAG: sulfotransferase domain-containing protein [Gammaproteobacteria bacterium]|nr:sulfotransferase domain-containing protein [Gammaproteobacteria bacterium]